MYIYIFYTDLFVSLLVGGFNPSGKYQSVGIIIPNIWKVIKFHGSKPQTSIYTNIGFPLPLTVHYLVGGFNHLEKYESQREGLSHISWKIKFMFQTTNQHISTITGISCSSSLRMNRICGRAPHHRFRLQETSAQAPKRGVSAKSTNSTVLGWVNNG